MASCSTRQFWDVCQSPLTVVLSLWIVGAWPHLVCSRGGGGGWVDYPNPPRRELVSIEVADNRAWMCFLSAVPQPLPTFSSFRVSGPSSLKWTWVVLCTWQRQRISDCNHWRRWYITGNHLLTAYGYLGRARAFWESLSPSARMLMDSVLGR